MPDVQAVDRIDFKRHQHKEIIEADMADEPEDPDAAADRLEAALERIAALAAMPLSPPVAEPEPEPEPDLSIHEIAERLDDLIGRLRAALGDAETKPK